ncbi:ABC transporter permease [Streptomyces sp. NPDC050560]|uniref:ABC transporter permease n=1 Tax=Streptomyces sp. NPDC050560 TaxID=3365630 RepID=UPI0037BB9155
MNNAPPSTDSTDSPGAQAVPAEAAAPPGTAAKAAPARGGAVPGKTPARRGRRPAKWLGAAGLRLAPFVLVLLLWWALSAGGAFDPTIIPGPKAVGTALWDGLITQGDMWSDLGATLYRAVLGLLIGAALGLVIGVLMGESKWVAHLLEPLISFAFPMPKLALLPLLIVVFGIGQTSLLVMVVLGAFFPMVVNTYAGVTGVSRVLLWNARTLGANKLQQLRTVVVFAALPHILSGIRVATGVAFLLVVAAEMISANDGLGYLIIFSQRNYRPDLVIAGILATAALGFVIDRLVSYASARLLAWQDSAR